MMKYKEMRDPHRDKTYAWLHDQAREAVRRIEEDRIKNATAMVALPAAVGGDGGDGVKDGALDGDGLKAAEAAKKDDGATPAKSSSSPKTRRNRDALRLLLLPAGLRRHAHTY